MKKIAKFCTFLLIIMSAILVLNHENEVHAHDINNEVDCIMCKELDNSKKELEPKSSGSGSGGGNYTPVPTILLKGKWLEQSGFKPGEYV